jgi:hypothetical protein
LLLNYLYLVIFSVYKELSLLKFGSGDFILFTYWNHNFFYKEPWLFLCILLPFYIINKCVVIIVFVNFIVRFLYLD